MNKWSFSTSCAEEGAPTLEFAFENLPVCSGSCCTAAEVLEILGQDALIDEQVPDNDAVRCEISIESDISDGDGEGCEDSAAPSLGLSSVLVSLAMSGLWWLYNL